MGRPLLSAEKLRVHQINVSLTSAELEFLKAQARIYKTSTTACFRKMALSKKPLRLPKATKLQLAYYKQLVPLASNINQITKKLNRGEYTRIHDELVRIRKLLTQIKDIYNGNSQTKAG